MENIKQQVNIDLKSAEDINCDECENAYFVPAFMIKRVSPLVSPVGQEMMVPVQLFQCASCGHVNKKFLE
jgi:hypothetical protein